MKYVTKPVEIEAIQWTGYNKEEIRNFCEEVAKFSLVKYLHDEKPSYWTLKIETLEGTMKAETGDYIIKGLRGEFYPCKPDVFHVKYKPVQNN